MAMRADPRTRNLDRDGVEGRGLPSRRAFFLPIPPAANPCHALGGHFKTGRARVSIGLEMFCYLIRGFVPIYVFPASIESRTMGLSQGIQHVEE